MDKSVNQEANLRRVVISTILGAVIEWYDFFLYGVVAGLLLNKLYFPTLDPTVGTLAAFATFAVGFVARPVGGVIFGHYGDKLGRKKMLIITLYMMGGATVAIGLIPTYDQIGIMAPVLLIFCRLLQGIGLGGEWGGAVLMTYESAPADKRAFYGSLPQIGMSIGLLLASGIIGLFSLLLTEESFLAWGWRIAFVISAGLLIVGSYMRTSVHETQDFAEAKATRPEVRFPLLDAFKRYPKILIACMGARFIDGVFFNIFAVFSLNYLTQHHNIDRTNSLWGVMIAAIVMTFFIPVWGHFADRIGKARLYGWGALAAGLSAFPAFWVITTYSHNIYLVWLAIAFPFGIFHSAYYATMPSLFSESFDPSVRYSGISFVYQFAAIFASGLTPIFATYLILWNNGQPWLLCAYVLGVGLMSAACTKWITRLCAASAKERPAPVVHQDEAVDSGDLLDDVAMSPVPQQSV